MGETGLIVLLAGAAAGCGAGLSALLVRGVIRGMADPAADQEGRHDALRVAASGPRSDRLPLLARLGVGLCAAVGRGVAPRLAWRMRRKLDHRLAAAGVPPALDATSFVGAQAIAAMTLAATAALGVSAIADSGFVLGAITGAVCGALWPRMWLRDRLAARRRDVVRALPFALDMITLCVEAGLNLQGALHQAVLRGPPGALRDELRHVLGDLRTGMARADALRALAARIDEPAVRAWVVALIQAEAAGISLGALLRSQSDQRRQDRFLRAETLALQAPVKLLLPLVVFIFPCTFLVIGFPIVVRLSAFVQ